MIKGYVYFTFIFVGIFLFETCMYISVTEKVAGYEKTVVSMQSEIEELQTEIEVLKKNQRIIAQDADFAVRLVVEGGTNEK